MSTLESFNRSNRILWQIGLLVLLIVLVSACGLGGALSSPEDSRGDKAVSEERVHPGDDTLTHVGAGESKVEAPAAEEAHPVEAEKEVETLALAPTASPAPLATAALAEPLPAGKMADGSEAEVAEGGVFAEADAEVAAVEVRQAEPLRAGEVDDNAQWDDYLLYRRTYFGPQVHDRDVSERYIIEVEDDLGNPVLDANVRVFLPGQQRQEIYSTRTYANGQALFHPLALDISTAQADRFLVEVQKDNLLEQFTLARLEAQPATSFSERWTVKLDRQTSFDAINLDVLFLIDATGSMSDEIAKIQSTIFDVAAQIDGLPGQPNVRYGMVTYRDRGDSFVSQVYDFTPDVRDFSQNLSTVWADGGGDYPESLNEGLHKAVNQVEWRSEDTVKLIFLVADAPPHLDYAQDYDYAVEMENAARRGIKIFPIASSGLDDQGEYIFRQLAQYTMGRFIFLTYEGPTNSGAPGDTTTHHVDEEDYSVENLDDLLVRLVEEELAYQNPQLARVQ